MVRVINQQQPPPIEQCASASYAKRFHPSPIEYLLANGPSRYRFSNLNERRFVPALPIHGNSSPTSWICIEPVVIIDRLWRSRKQTEQQPPSKGAAFASRGLIDAVRRFRAGEKKRRTFQQTWFPIYCLGECDERTRWKRNWKSFISAFEEYSRQSARSVVCITSKIGFHRGKPYERLESYIESSQNSSIIKITKKNV